MIEWMEDLLRPDALKPVSKELVVCPAFELYEEPRLATEFLTAHNIFRCTAGLAMLEWDLHAFQTARKYAEKAPTDSLSHSDTAERKNQRNTQGGKFRPNRAGLGHYTQLVWRKTLRVGCSLGQNKRVAVCHYDPAGNEKGKHLSQVAAPLPGYHGIEGQERCGAIVERIGAS